MKLDLDTANHASAAKLSLKIKPVSDGKKEDMREAVTQVGRQDIAGLPSMVADVTGVVQAADSFVQGAVSFTETWSPILDKLEALQRIGDCLSEVSPFIAFFILDISQPATKVHPYAKIAWSILNFIPKVNLFHSKLVSANEEMQEVQKQVALDANVTSLADIMNDTFDLVEKADKLRRESKSKIVMRIVQQTTECAWFIRDYRKIEEFCKLHKIV